MLLDPEMNNIGFHALRNVEGWRIPFLKLSLKSVCAVIVSTANPGREKRIGGLLRAEKGIPEVPSVGSVPNGTEGREFTVPEEESSEGISKRECRAVIASTANPGREKRIGGLLCAEKGIPEIPSVGSIPDENGTEGREFTVPEEESSEGISERKCRRRNSDHKGFPAGHQRWITTRKARF